MKLMCGMLQLMEGLSPFQRERVAAQMCRPKFVRQLLDQFRVRYCCQ